MELMKNGIIKNWSSVFGHRPEGYDIEVANFDNRGALEVLKSEVSNLPNDKPYTLAAQQYANILMDKLIYGDTYVVAHHLASLQSLAQLCEPLYKETVVLSRNMLAGLGYETYYDDAQCTQSVEPRSIQNKSDRNVSLMPNPTNGKLTIEYAGDIARIDIMNLQE
ncbi:MAG: hypothetical protein R2774_10545 [Saprospiraceae bacterium]